MDLSSNVQFFCCLRMQNADWKLGVTLQEMTFKPVSVVCFRTSICDMMT